MALRERRDLGLLLALLSAALLTGGSAFGYSGGGDTGGDDWAADGMANGCSCHNLEQSQDGMWSPNNFPARYEPGATYNLSLTVSDPSVADAADPAAQGGFLLRVTNGSFSGGAGFWTSDDGSLLSHTADTNDQRNWTVEWTASDEGAGDAVLTLYFNVVNGENGNDAGDRKYPDAAAFASTGVEELGKDIHSTGFFNAKARHIIGACSAIIEHHGGEVPRTLAELVTLPGVGRKTASVVLGVVWGLAEGVVVDTHVYRLTRRLGFSRGNSPEAVERDLIALLPQEDWIEWSDRLIWHGRRVCDARKPHCFGCFAKAICPQVGVTRREQV